MTERVVLHIGLEKAGSTSIQEGLAMLEPRLAAYGVTLSAAGRHRPTMARNMLPWRDPEAPEWDVLRRELRRPDGGTHTLLVSNQALWRQRDGILRRLRRFLDDRPAHVVLYVRDQAELLQSMAMQSQKNARRVFDFDDPAVFAEFAASRTPNYLEVCERFEQLMGAEVEVRLFDPDAFVGGELLADFLSVLVPDVELAQPPDPHANPSLAPDIARVLHNPEVNAIDASADEVLDVALRLSAEPYHTKYFLDEASVRRLRDACRDYNRLCLARYLRGAGEIREHPAWVVEGATNGLTADRLGARIAEELAWGPRMAPGWRGKTGPIDDLFGEGWTFVDSDGTTAARMTDTWSSLRFRTDFQRECSVNGALELRLTLATIDPTPVRVSVNGESIATVDLTTEPIPLPDAERARGRWEIGLEAPPGPRNIEVVRLQVTYGPVVRARV